MDVYQKPSKLAYFKNLGLNEGGMEINEEEKEGDIKEVDIKETILIASLISAMEIGPILPLKANPVEGPNGAEIEIEVNEEEEEGEEEDNSPLSNSEEEKSKMENFQD